LNARTVEFNLPVAIQVMGPEGLASQDKTTNSSLNCCFHLGQTLPRLKRKFRILTTKLHLYKIVIKIDPWIWYTDNGANQETYALKGKPSKFQKLLLGYFPFGIGGLATASLV
jgi:hypothetical protein